jgi:hypothetical protein
LVGEGVRHYQGKSVDLDRLAQQVEEYLTSEHFTVQHSPSSAHGTVIQARKGGWLEGIIAADRALTITISGEPDDALVRVGIGKWLEHLGVAAAETLLLSVLFLPVDVGEMAWNLEIENKLLKQIDGFVGADA